MAMFRAQQNAFDDAVGESFMFLVSVGIPVAGRMLDLIPELRRSARDSVTLVLWIYANLRLPL